MQLEAREKRFLIFGSVIIVLLLAYLLWPSSSAPRSSVELVPADQRGAAGPPPSITPPAPPPTPVQTVAAPPPTPASVASMPGGIPAGLTLTGIAGRGAIFSMADGSQRYIPQGRELAPGVVLQAVRMREVLLAAGGSDYRLGFGGMPVAVAAPVGPPVVQAPRSPDQARVNSLRAESASIQAALSPRQVGGRISGYYVGVAESPTLQRAGVQPGDLILSVNGSELGPQSFAGLSQSVQNGERIEFEVERGGQRLRLAVPPGR